MLFCWAVGYNINRVDTSWISRGSFSKNIFQYLTDIYVTKIYFKHIEIFIQCKHMFENYLLIYLGSYVAFNTVQLISRQVVQRAEETSTYSWSRFCTVNCRPTASNYQLSHLRSGRELNPDLRGGRRECYPSATMAPFEN